jgi:hypothetical protein
MAKENVGVLRCGNGRQLERNWIQIDRVSQGRVEDGDRVQKDGKKRYKNCG